MLSTRHQKQSTTGKQTKKKHKALENSTPNESHKSIIEVGWGWMAGVSQTWREETTRWRAHVPHHSSPACSDARGMKAAKKGALPTGRWHSGGHHDRLPPVSVGQSSAAFSTRPGCYKSPLSLRWTLLWGITEGRRCGGGQDALGGRNHRVLAALLNSGKPFGPVCWKLKEYLNRKMILFKSISNTLSLSISCQGENN